MARQADVGVWEVFGLKSLLAFLTCYWLSDSCFEIRTSGHAGEVWMCKLGSRFLSFQCAVLVTYVLCERANPSRVIQCWAFYQNFVEIYSTANDSLANVRLSVPVGSILIKQALPAVKLPWHSNWNPWLYASLIADTVNDQSEGQFVECHVRIAVCGYLSFA